MSNRVEINYENIRQTTATLTSMEGIQFDLAVSDNSLEPLQQCIEMINTMGKDIENTVRQYDTFLNNLADSFKTADIELSQKIQSAAMDSSASDDYFAP